MCHEAWLIQVMINQTWSLEEQTIDQGWITYRAIYYHAQSAHIQARTNLNSKGILFCLFLSLKVNKLALWSHGWGQRSGLTRKQGVTGLGHLDFSPEEQMLVAAVWLSPRRPRNRSSGPWMDAGNYPGSPGKEMTRAHHSWRSQGRN